MNTATRQSLTEFEYTKLDQDDTQKFIMSIARLMDSVFETKEQDFENYAKNHEDLVFDDPAELFDLFFKALEGATLTKYQSQFNNFAQVNIGTIFKWYRKNHGNVNVSPKQIAWFKRWFVKHNVGHEFLLEQDPDYNRSIKPNFGAI